MRTAFIFLHLVCDNSLPYRAYPDTRAAMCCRAQPPPRPVPCRKPSTGVPVGRGLPTPVPTRALHHTPTPRHAVCEKISANRQTSFTDRLKEYRSPIQLRVVRQHRVGACQREVCTKARPLGNLLQSAAMRAVHLRCSTAIAATHLHSTYVESVKEDRCCRVFRENH